MKKINTIVKNTGMLLVFNIIKVFSPLIILPYLTRVLSIECFSVVAYVKAVMQYMQIFVDFGFTLSGTKDVALVRNDKNRLNAAVCDILIAKIMISMLAFIVLLVMNSNITILNGNQCFTILSFVGVFLSCFFLDYLFRGLEKMEFITIRFMVMKVFTTILTFYMVKTDSDILWVPILDILGSLIAIVLVWKQVLKLGIVFKINSIVSVMKKIKDSSIYFFSMISTTAFGALNTIIIGMLLPEIQVAFWTICQQLVNGIQYLYNPLTSSIYPKMIKNRDFNLINKIINICTPVVISGCLISYFVSDYIVIFVAGVKYLPAGELFRYFVPVVFFSFFTLLYGWPVLGALGKQKEVTITNICAAVFQTVGLFILYLTDIFTLFNVAILRSITEAGLFLLRYLYFRKFLKCNIGVISLYERK